MTSKAGYKAMKETKGKRIRILAPKKVLLRLPIALAQEKKREIHQIIY